MMELQTRWKSVRAPSVSESACEFADAHDDACFSGFLTLMTACCFILCLMAGAPAEWIHVISGAVGYGTLFGIAYVAARRHPGRRAHPPFTDCRFAFVLVAFAAAVWRVPALLEAAPAALMIVFCFSGGVDGAFCGRVAAYRGSSLGATLKAVLSVIGSGERPPDRRR